jgi:anti-sigma factor ChrR (cupin superfamily)
MRGYAMKEAALNYQEMQWEKAPNYPPGTMMKVLRRDEEGCPLTIILKVGEGFKMESHSHVGIEQHFVLEGEYQSEGDIYQAGYYRLIPERTSHGPFHSEKGAVILVMWDQK